MQIHKVRPRIWTKSEKIIYNFTSRPGFSELGIHLRDLGCLEYIFYEKSRFFEKNFFFSYRKKISNFFFCEKYRKFQVVFHENAVTLVTRGVGWATGYQNIHKNDVGDARSTQNDVPGTLDFPFCGKIEIL